jgi:hypothetical protein
MVEFELDVVKVMNLDSNIHNKVLKLQHFILIR